MLGKEMRPDLKENKKAKMGRRIDGGKDNGDLTKMRQRSKAG